MHTLRVQQLIIVIFLFMLLNISFPASAADHERVRFQGKVMELSSKKENIMIVSERPIVWNEATGFYNDKGASISVRNIGKQNWVYIDGVNDGKSRKVVAQKIYLLPKYIEKKERGLYSFMSEK